MFKIKNYFKRRAQTTLVRDGMFNPNREYFMNVLYGMNSTEVEVIAVPYSERQRHKFTKRQGIDGTKALDFVEQTLKEWDIPNLVFPCSHNPFFALHTQKAGLDRITLLLGTFPNPDTRYDLSVEIKQSAT